MRYEQISELCTRGLVKKKKDKFVERVRARATLRLFYILLAYGCSIRFT